MNQHDVYVATYTFDHNDPNRPETWERPVAYVEGDIPIRMNPLFVPQAVESLTDSGVPYIHTNSYFYGPFSRIVKESKAANK